MAQNLEIVINAQDKTDAAFSKAQRSLDSFSDKLEGMKPQFSALAGAGTVAFGALSAIAVTTLKAYVDAQAQTEIANKSLENTLSGLTRTTQAHTITTGLSTKQTKENADKVSELKNKLETYHDQLAVATARVNDMNIKMTTGKKITESQKVAYEQAKERVAELKDEIGKTDIKIGSLNGVMGKHISVIAGTVGEYEKLQKQLGGKNIDVFKALQKEMDNAGKAAIKLGFDDETAATSFTKLFAVTKDVTKAQKEVTLAMDLARYKNISLEEATQKLVMVHSGATKELKALGLAVDDGASAMQNLDAIQRQVGNSADTFAQTTAGAMEILTVRIDNLKETIGGSLEPAFTRLLSKVEPVLARFEQWAEKNPELISKIVIMGGAIAGLVAGVGLLGLALPAIITAFSLLLGPVGLVIAAIALVVINFDYLKQKAIELMQVLEDNGVFIYFHEIWTNISNNFQQNLLPALQQLWTALQPLVPYFTLFAKILGVTFMVALMAVGKILEGWIFLFSMLLEAAVKIGTYLATVLKGVFDTIGASISYVVDKVNTLINGLQSLWSSMSKFGGSAMSSIGGLFGGSTKVNDAIIQPNGRVITPANDDYIVATKNPNSLFGGNSTGAFNININGAIFTEDAATTLGNLIVDKFKTASRVGL